MFELDELKIYKGDDIYITPDIVVMQPTIGQIADFGEKRYFGAVHTLTASGADMKWQLWDYANIDYTTIEDYDLFVTFTYQIMSSNKKIYQEIIDNPDKYADEIANIPKDAIEEMNINPLQLILKDIDLADFTPCTHEGTGEIVLYNIERDITIDKLIYTQIVNAVRKIHGLKRNDEKPGNETTKMILIEEARENAAIVADKPHKSTLTPLVSAITVKCGMCGDDRIWNMKVSQFFDNIKRISKIQESNLLLQGAYSGFASLKGVDKSRLDWAGEI